MLAELSRQRQKAESQLLRAQTAEAYYQLLLKNAAAPQAAAAAAAAAQQQQLLLQCTLAEQPVRRPLKPSRLHPRLSTQTT
jgi:hypothetical protein